MEVPTEWSECRLGSWVARGFVRGQDYLGAQISASPDFERWSSSWTTPGVFFGASRILRDTYPQNTVGQIFKLDTSNYSASCQLQATQHYADYSYVGKEQIWVNCGGTNTVFHNIIALPVDKSYVVQVQITLVSEADSKAYEQIINSF
jgi:serine protease Do